MTIYLQQTGKYFLLSSLLCLALSLPACTVGPDYIIPETTDSIAISKIVYPDLRFEQTDLSHWWDIFEDSHLSSLIERGEQNYLNIKMALARVKEARALLGIEDSGLYPSIDSKGTIAWGKESENVNPTATSTATQYSLSADASWEIDLFGRIRRSVEAASAEYQASWEEHNEVLITVRAEIASNYLYLRSLQARFQTAEKNILSQKDMLRLTQIRYKNGIATYLDVTQAARVLAATEADIPVIRQDMMQTTTALSVLTGTPSDTLRSELHTILPVPMPAANIAVGIPAERIRQRPDIKQAERKLAAQTARIGVATADLYPSFSLFGTLGLATLKADSFLDSASVVYGLTPSLEWNIFDMGRIRQNIKVQDARTEQALYNYELTMLQAIKEVEDALSGYHEQKLRLTALNKSVSAAKESLKMSTILYKDGLTAFQDVLDAQRSLFNQESARDQSTGNVVIQLVTLYKALAGGWTTQSEKEQAPYAQ
jgi:NodT family efflux transporter outer membrane factor (OMF) lipoprotein